MLLHPHILSTHTPIPVCIWALHFLSTSEEVQDKLHQELEQVLDSESVSLEKIPQFRSALVSLAN